MKMQLHEWKLPLARTFTISRESIDFQSSVIVELQHEGFTGLGEVTANRFYDHDVDQLKRNLVQAKTMMDLYHDHSPDEVWEQMLEAVDGDRFAASALDMAAHDLHSKRLGIPTWKAWGLVWENVVDSSYTIGIDTPDAMAENLQEHPGWSVYKIKLGTPDDMALVRHLRKFTEAIFRVDANCGWTSSETIQHAEELKKLGVQWIEQPLPIEASDEDKLTVYRNSALPIFADEDCQVFEDVSRCSQYFHGVNVKVCKCGGLTPALKMLRQAKELKLKTMVGCMVESSIGISGAAQLLPLLDYVDLDGAVLLRDEPASGVRVECGKIHLADGAGSGGQIHHEQVSDYLVEPIQPN